MGIEILSTGHYVPENIISNDDLAKIMDTSHEWIVSRTGIEERRFANENTSSLALKAIEDCLNKVDIDMSKIGLVVCSTMTGDDFTPSTACKLLEALGLNNVMAFDINAACSGFVYALDVANALLSVHNYEYALVIGAEKLSKLIDFSDRSSAILFGDGAACALIKKSEKPSYFRSLAKADIDHCLYARGINPSELLTNSKCEDFYLKMQGQDVYRFALSALEDGINSILKEANLCLDDIKLIIPHQANIRIINSVKKKLKIADEKVFVNLEKYGNTSASSIPLGLDEALNESKLMKGDKVLLVGFGSGLTWASAILEI